MRRTLVVDASVAFKWFVDEADNEAALDLLSADIDLVAPRLLRIEIANAFWKSCRRGFSTPEQAKAGFAMLDRTIARWYETEPLLDRAFDLAIALDHPVYDLCYLALAESIGSRCMTADARFLHMAARTGHAAIVHRLHRTAT